MSRDQSHFEELRTLLLRPEQEHLEDLEARLLDPQRLADHVSRALPIAVRRSHEDNTLLARALSPLIEEAFKKSIRKNPKLLADILFPVIGRAVRKAVGEAWQRMLQQINEVLETRLSPRSLKWRWQARRSGRPYIEVVLANTLVFRVEEVFLIHRETGLLLHHKGIGAELTETEVVSSMFTAIQDFVKDSFRVDQESMLASLQLDDLTVWVEPGPYAYLAAVIRGHPPEALRQVLQVNLEEIHFGFARDLEHFSGDTEPFEAAQDQLDNCMVSQLQQKENKNTRLTGLAIAMLVAALLGWISWTRYVVHRDLTVIRETLQQEQGYRLTRARAAAGNYHIEGLKDPLAEPLESVLAGASLSRPVTADLQSYLSLEGSFLLSRVRRAVNPPPEVDLDLQDGVLVFRGKADVPWRRQTEKLLPLLPGITAWDLSGLEAAVDPIAEKNKQFQVEAAALENWVIYFNVNETELSDTLSPKIQEAAPRVQRLFALADELDKDIVLVVAGYSDSMGSEEYNLKISSQRARSVADFLVAEGIDPGRMLTEGRGSSGATADLNPERMRRVQLTVQIQTKP
ncbi:MAG: OmpA family protein [Acidobacteriota bacterium]|nr:OmpA family protein [Acidobacteriota bacterium]